MALWQEKPEPERKLKAEVRRLDAETSIVENAETKLKHRSAMLPSEFLMQIFLCNQAIPLFKYVT